MKWMKSCNNLQLPEKITVTDSNVVYTEAVECGA